MSWKIVCALLSLATPAQDSLTTTGEVERVTLGPEDPVEPDRGRHRALLVVAPATGRLHLRAASVEVDPSLTVFRADGAPLDDDNGGGGTTAYLALDVEGGDHVEVGVFGRGAPEAAAGIDVAASLAAETETSLALAREVDGALQALDLDAPDAAARAEELVELLASSDELGPTARAVAERLAALPRRVRTVAFDLRVRALLYEHARRHLPATHRRRLDAQSYLAIALKDADRLEQARDLETALLATRRTFAPDSDRAVQIARLNLAATCFRLGDLDAASQVFAELLELADGTLPENDALLMAARQNHAAVLLQLGDAARAAKLYRTILAVLEAAAPGGAGDANAAIATARVQRNLAKALLLLYRVEEAADLLQAAVDGVSGAVAPDHPELLRTELTRSNALAQLGDLEAAQVVQERVLAIQLEHLRDDDLELQVTRHTLAATLVASRELEDARALLERVVAVRSRRLPADHPDLLRARIDLGLALVYLHDVAAGRASFEAVLASLPADLPPSHPLVLTARQDLAWTWSEEGQLERAAEIQAEAVEIVRTLRPPDDPDRANALINLAWTRLRQGDREAAVVLTAEALDVVRTRVDAFRPRRGPRELETIVQRTARAVSEALSVLAEGGTEPELERTAFELIESTRAIGIVHRRLTRELARSPAGELEALADAADDADLAVVRSARTGSEDFFDAVRRRDAAQRALRARLAAADTGVATGTVDARALANELAEDEAAVTFWRYQRMTVDPATRAARRPVPHYLAYVLRAGREPARVELGPAAAIDTAAALWRAALGTARQRGMAVTDTVGSQQVSERDRGAVLRALVLDPLMPLVGDARTLHVALDGALHTVPLDALPLDPQIDEDGYELGGGDRVAGDVWSVAVWTALSLRRLDRGAPREPVLLALGGIEYDLLPDDVTPEARTRPVPAAGQRGAPSLRDRAWSPSFRFLVETEPEAKAIAHAMRRAHPDAATHMLAGQAASRAAFERLAPEASFLHIATHAYFAPESIPSLRADSASRGGARGLDPRGQVRGFAPMLLCGLAFAGANLPGEDGRLANVMTAEELARLDLVGCELAVLSACETGAGTHRAGQGIASLQSALHAAGVRTAVTSLWKVPDSAAAELMQQFYRSLWVLGRSKAEALQDAKNTLRRRVDTNGRPVYATRDWAAWVLSGDPR